MKSSLLAAALATAAFAVGPALAQSAGDWTLGLGLGYVMPKDDNGTLDGGLDVSVGDNARPTITFEYFVADNLGIEVLGAWPFEHNITIDGLGKVGSTQHLPPTVSLQYHFQATPTVSPFVGLGLNYTTFFETDTSGALKGTDLDLKDSWGVAVHLGLDYAVSERSAVRADIRWIDIDTKAELNGTEIGTVKIDPLVFGVSYIWKF